jgi:hypothetical protein
VKRIPHPVVDDNAILDQVAGRRPVADCPHIQADTQTVRARYDAYVNAHGNPFAQGCPQPLAMLGLLQNALHDRYGSDAAYLRPIESLRTNKTLNVCPMCGLPGTGTLDHIFPQSVYRELSIFSSNLVPTCFRCNTKHQANYCGANAGERIFHPYFDDALNNRLVRATIQPNPTFATPLIGLASCLGAHDPLHATVDYHIGTVLTAADVINDLIVLWADLRRFPRMKLSTLPQGNFSDADFNGAVIQARDMADQWRTTPNNFESMMLEGLRLTPAASVYLAQWVRDLDADPDLAQDV